MSSDGAAETVRTGGSTDGGRTTRTVVVALGVLAIGLAVLGSAGVAGAASDGAAAEQNGEVNVTIVFEDEPGNVEPEVSTDESFTLTAKPTGNSQYTVEDLTFTWDVVESAEGKNVTNGNTLTYEPAETDAGNVTGFEVEATAENGASGTAGIGVGIETSPTADLQALDDPEGQVIEGGEELDTVSLSGFNSSDPNNALGQLDFQWEYSGSGDLQELSELNENYTVDFAALYEVGPDDAGETFDITLTVTDPRGLSDTDSITVSVDDDGTLGFPAFGGGSDDSPTSSPAEAGFEIASISAPSTVEAGEDVEVTLEIENVGDEDGTATVDVGFGDDAIETVALDVPAGETRETTVTVAAPAEPGDYALGVDTRDDVGSYSVTVEDGTVSDGGSDDTSTDDSQSGFGLSSLLGAVFILALVGVAVRQFAT